MCFHCFFSLIYRILKLQNVKIELAVVMQTVYKAPGQANGKIIESTAAGAWQDGAQALSSNNGHSFATALQHVVGNNANAKFLAYNNAPPGVPNLKTRSNSKGVILLATNADSAAWTVHTVPGFPAAKTGYSWPVAENARGHLLICLTIVKSQINAIAASLLLVQPLIHYNDIPKTETAAMPYFNKLAEGKIPTLPPFTSRLTIRTQSPGTPVTVHIYSKSESSKYEIYKKVIVKVLKKTIKVWSRRDSKLKGDCRGSQRHIRLIKSPAVVVDHNTNLEADITNWAVSDPGNIFCHIDKPYFKNQTREPAMASWRAILYKAPGQATGKIIEATDAARDWQDGAQPLNNNAQHSFATALQHVVGDNPNVKFLAYNNAPPGVPSIKTKSNSKGIIILSIAPGTDSAAWIVHTVPGFPAAKTGYNWPLAENARGHLLICLTISESQINAIAASLLLVQPMVHYNDIPETETAAMPYFNKLAEGKIPTLPPFTSRQTIRTQSGAAAVTVHIYSKSETSKYAAINGHNTNLESDITNWAVSDPGNIFCHIDKPYLEWSFGILEKTVYRLPNNTVYHVVCENLLEKAIIKGTIKLAVLGYLFLNKIAPLVSFRSDKSMEEAIDTADNQGHQAIVYKAPGQANGKIIEATAAAQDWQDGAQALNNRDQHSFAKALEHVVGDNQNVKFLAYNNAPPGVGNVKTKSNSKGVIILSTTTDSAAWIVHTVPGFPAAKTGYSWPVAENARGHLLICLTISESQINAIGAWQDGAQALSSNNGHSFATALQHVVGNNANAKFLAYNNAPPGVPNLKTRSNSKGVILLATNADSAAWTVHTVPGFPAAKTGYSWPVAENARGHLLICLTIVKSQINAIAASLLLVQPLIHYNDIPKTETAAMPYFNKLAEGKIPTLPPFTSRLTIRTQSPGTPVTVHIYKIYKKVIVKVLKKTIKVWSRRDSKLKGDCRGSQRHIRLIKSPAVVVDHNTNLEADITNWAVSDPGNIFCHIDKPYFNFTKKLFESFEKSAKMQITKIQEK
ncbi:Deoxyribonuclease-2-alpha [Trichinella spiralis]|uniref:Deoxyribonuclease-2-alpha n=1 Tax=Trichinella spiralis TaxID=6334 RepID=A0A0V1AR56_TRISP|nr:Deoxyribonuclease-2-alpha [Trichinella spiralis]